MLRDIKTFKLWRVLSLTERKKLRFVINNRKNTRQKNLLFFLEKNEAKLGNVSKSIVYKKVFGTDYRPEDDFRLRNEFRLFNVLIEEVIAQEALIASRPNLYHELFLKELMTRGLTEMAEAELNSAIAEARSNGDIHTAYRYTLVLLDHKFEYTKMKREEYLQLRQLLVETIFLQAMTYNEFKAMLDVKIGYAERVLYLFDQSIERANTDALNIVHREIDISERTLYDRIKYQFYDPDADVRLSAMEKALVFLDEHPKTRVDHSEERIKIRMHIATVLTAKEKYIDALEQYEKLAQDIPKVSKTMQSGFFFNYVATLARLHRYEEAIRRIKEHSYLLRDHTIKERFLCIYISLHILQGKITDAHKLIPEDIRQGEEDTYYYLRLVSAIIQFEFGHLSVALNELKNLRKLLKKSVIPVSALIETAELLDRMLRICSAAAREDTSQKRRDLRTASIQMEARLGNFHEGSLIQTWLVRRIHEICGDT